MYTLSSETDHLWNLFEALDGENMVFFFGGDTAVLCL